MFSMQNLKSQPNMKKQQSQVAEIKSLIRKSPVAQDISDQAKAIVVHKAIELQDRGDFSPIDIDLLVMYALNIELIKQIDKELSTDGLSVTMVDRYGNSRLVPHPGIKARKDLVAEVRRLGKVFGFTPFDSQHIETRRKSLSDIWEDMWKEDEDG